jgi:phosphopantetheinyl transferase
MDIEKIKEAVEHLKFELSFKNLESEEGEEALNKKRIDIFEILLSLAESVLKAQEGLPKKEKDIRCACDGWNTAIDLCTLSVAKNHVRGLGDE